jgi:hypothetical protein
MKRLAIPLLGSLSGSLLVSLPYLHHKHTLYANCHVHKEKILSLVSEPNRKELDKQIPSWPASPIRTVLYASLGGFIGFAFPSISIASFLYLLLTQNVNNFISKEQAHYLAVRDHVESFLPYEKVDNKDTSDYIEMRKILASKQEENETIKQIIKKVI